MGTGQHRDGKAVATSMTEHPLAEGAATFLEGRIQSPLGEVDVGWLSSTSSATIDFSNNVSYHLAANFSIFPHN